MKYKIEATIPTTQYGNLRPTFEVETPEEEESALESLKRLWERFGENPLVDSMVKIGVPAQEQAVKITTFTGEEVYWNESTHTYTDMDGKVFLSGSKYAKLHSPKFPKDIILPKTATKWGMKPEELDGIWSAKGDISLDFGNAVHKALELYHNHYVVGEKIQEISEGKVNYALHGNVVLKGIVESFVEQFGADALSEVVVSDTKNLRAGTIDRLEILDEAKKVCRVGDYKTNAEIKKPKLLEYQKQLSFYAHILIEKGWTVEGLDLYHLKDGTEWVKTELEVLDLE